MRNRFIQAMAVEGRCTRIAGSGLGGIADFGRGSGFSASGLRGCAVIVERLSADAGRGTNGEGRLRALGTNLDVHSAVVDEWLLYGNLGWPIGVNRRCCPSAGSQDICRAVTNIRRANIS